MTEKAQQRKLSFIDDQISGNMASDSEKVKKSNYIAPPPTLAGTERRQSNWNQGNAPRRSIYNKRLSISLSHSSRKSSQDQTFTRIKYQNTYRTEPEENAKFLAYKFEPKIYSLLEEALKNKKYDPSKAESLSKELSQDILRETRNWVTTLSPRYKLIAHVVIGESNGNFNSFFKKSND